MKCPICGTQAKYEIIEDLWRCSFCHAEFHTDGIPLNWPEIVHKMIDDYSMSIASYVPILDKGMLDNTLAPSLVELYELSFQSEIVQIQKALASFLIRPNYAEELKTLRTLTGAVYCQFYGAYLAVENFDSAADCLRVALELVPEDDKIYSEILNAKEKLFKGTKALGHQLSYTAIQIPFEKDFMQALAAQTNQAASPPKTMPSSHTSLQKDTDKKLDINKILPMPIIIIIGILLYLLLIYLVS